MKALAPYLIYGILLFHLAAAGLAFWTMFSDYRGWTLYHAYPFGIVLFTSLWIAIACGKRWGAFGYFLLVFAELAIKLFFGAFSFGKIFGAILFPIDLLFAFVILLLYKLHFGDRSVGAAN